MAAHQSLDSIEACIVRGELGAAGEALRAVKAYRLDLAAAVHYAQLCWRAGIPLLGVWRLRREIRDARGRLVLSRPSAVAEYAQCLVRLGAVDEAESLLDAIPPAKSPRRLFYKAAVLIARWEHESAVPFLKAYLRSSRLRPYELAVGKLNLAAVLIVAGKGRQAEPLLRDVTYRASLGDWRLLLMRALELTAEWYITAKRWDEAERFIEEALRRRASPVGVDSLIVEKTRATVKALRSRGKAADIAQLEAVRDEARRRKHWETVRDCDRVQAVACQDLALARHVHFGTPYPGYRRKLAEALGDDSLEHERSYDWCPLGPAPKRGLDLLSGRSFDGSSALETGSILHRLAVSLASDFYRPFRMAALFALLHPDRIFDPETSPVAVRDSVKRLRAHFRRHSLPLDVVEDEGYYSLKFLSPFCLRAYRDETVGLRYSGELATLRRELTARPFTVADATRILGKPRRTVQRLLAEHVEAGRLRREGTRRAARYGFPAD